MKYYLLIILLITIVYSILENIIDKEYITLFYQVNESYISKYIFKEKNVDIFEYNYNCNIDGDLRMCNLTTDNNFKFHAFGSEQTEKKTADGIQFPGIFSNILPIFEPELKPETKGGSFQSNITYFLLTTNQNALFQNDYEKIDFLISPNGKNGSEYLMIFPSGCGFFKIFGLSFVYNSSYQNPYIEKVEINKKTVTLIGSNFCTEMYPKEILINNQKIKNEQIIKNDHEYIEFIFEYSEFFCTSFTIQLIASKVPSNKMDLVYPPVLNSINSIPRNKNATININGERLTSNSSIIIAEVKIGDYPCSIITLSPNNITCYMAHRILDNNLPVTVNIDGITNQNKIYFNYDSTLISSYSISNGVLTIYGQCLGEVGSVTIFNDKIPISLQNLQINDNETVMSFTIPEAMSYINISVKSYEKQSNSYFIGLSFITKFVTQPMVNGSNCIVKFFNSSYDENKENPILSIYSDFGDEFKSTGTLIGKNSNDLDYSFFIVPGCGKKGYNINFENKSYQSTFNYKKPIIESCYTKDEFIICTGEFNNYGFYNNTFITFSNQSLSPIKISSNEITTKKEPYFTSDLITICCCGIISDPYELTIKPTIKGAISKPFDNNGSIVFIDGENFHSKQNVSLECGNYKFGCTYLNHSSFSCDSTCQSEDYFCPHVEQCIINSMDQSISFNITFNGPTINKVGTISNYQKDHWVLALSGFNFYPLKTSLIIDGQKRCTISYSFSTEIGCAIANDILLNFFLPRINSTFEINVTSNQIVHISRYNLIFQNISEKEYIYINNNTKSQEESSRVDWKKIVISLVTIIFAPLLFIFLIIFFKIPERFFMSIKRERIIENVENNHSTKGDEYLQTREVYNNQRMIFLDMYDNIIMAEDPLRIPKNNNLRNRNSKNKNNNNNDLACSSINNSSDSNSNTIINSNNNNNNTIGDVAFSSNNKINNNNISNNNNNDVACSSNNNKTNYNNNNISNNNNNNVACSSINNKTNNNNISNNNNNDVACSSNNNKINNNNISNNKNNDVACSSNNNKINNNNISNNNNKDVACSSNNNKINNNNNISNNNKNDVACSSNNNKTNNDLARSSINNNKTNNINSSNNNNNNTIGDVACSSNNNNKINNNN